MALAEALFSKQIQSDDDWNPGLFTAWGSFLFTLGSGNMGVRHFLETGGYPIVFEKPYFY